MGKNRADTTRIAVSFRTSNRGSSGVRLAALCAVGLCAAVSLGRPAAAQEDENLGWRYSVGGGMLVAPNYEGSKHYRISGLPLLEASWQDTLSLSVAEGLSLKIRPLADRGFFLSAGLGYWLGRKEGVDKDDADALRGLGNLSGGAVGKLGVGYRIGALSLGVDIAGDIKNDRDGTTVTPSLGYEIVRGRKFTLGGKLSATWADENYMQNIFGVTAAQSAASLKSYRTFTPESGFKDAKIGLRASYAITPSLSAFASTDVARLIGDAADSPIVKTEGSATQFIGTAGLVYRF